MNDRGSDVDERTPPTPFDDDEVDDAGEGAEVQPVALPLVVEDMRCVREPSRTVAENMAHARRRADELPRGPWRSANLVFTAVVGNPLKLVLRALDWALTEGGLGRAIPAVAVLLAVAFALNHIPLTAWLVPDQLDVATWLPQPSPEMVEVPIVAPGSAG